MGQRVQYQAVRDRVSMWSVWLMADVAWLVGYVRETTDGRRSRWQARLRSQPQETAIHGFLRWRDAAAYLLVAAAFCRRR